MRWECLKIRVATTSFYLGVPALTAHPAPAGRKPRMQLKESHTQGQGGSLDHSGHRLHSLA